MTRVALNIEVHACFRIRVFIYSREMPWRGTAGSHVVTLVLVSKGTSVLVLTVASPIYTPAHNSGGGGGFSQIFLIFSLTLLFSESLALRLHSCLVQLHDQFHEESEPPGLPAAPSPPGVTSRKNGAQPVHNPAAQSHQTLLYSQKNKNQNPKTTTLKGLEYLEKHQLGRQGQAGSRRRGDNCAGASNFPVKSACVCAVPTSRSAWPCLFCWLASSPSAR